jgi:hypothetical protein
MSSCKIVDIFCQIVNKFWFSREILLKSPKSNFTVILPFASQTDTRVQTDRRTYDEDRRVRRDSTNEPKIFVAAYISPHISNVTLGLFAQVSDINRLKRSAYYIVHHLLWEETLLFFTVHFHFLWLSLKNQYFLEQYQPFGVCNWDAECLLWNKEGSFKYNISGVIK